MAFAGGGMNGSFGSFGSYGAVSADAASGIIGGLATLGSSIANAVASGKDAKAIREAAVLDYQKSAEQNAAALKLGRQQIKVAKIQTVSASVPVSQTQGMVPVQPQAPAMGGYGLGAIAFVALLGGGYWLWQKSQDTKPLRVRA